MKECPSCHKLLEDTDCFCSYCGCRLDSIPYKEKEPQYQGNYSAYRQSSEDMPSLGYALLGFFLPLIALFVYFKEKDNYPRKAESLLHGAFVKLVFWVIILFK